METVLRKRIEEATRRFNSSVKCKEVYTMLSAKYPKEMQCFKDFVFDTMILHPDWSEEQILKESLKHFAA